MPHQAAAVLSFGITARQWLFGTDCASRDPDATDRAVPYAPQVAIVASRAGIDNEKTLLTPATRNDLLRNNAERLFDL